MLSASQHYEAFAAVVRTGNVTTAARELKIPRPTLSRRLARLEADLGVALLHRTTRRVNPTPAGQRLYEGLEPLLAGLDALERAVREEADAVTGTVRISVLPLLASALGPLCHRLHGAHPELTIEVVANVRLVDLRSEGFDIAIWAGDIRDPGLVARRLLVGHVGLVAAPGYLERRGSPRSVDDLAAHDLLRGHSASGRARSRWPLFDGGHVPIDGRLVSDDHSLLRAAALQGLGITLLPDLNVADDLAEGRLVRVLERSVGTEAVVWVVVARRSLMPARVRAVLDAVFEHFDAGPLG
jgi:DNA-binding transcriptional LysR family regulator